RFGARDWLRRLRAALPPVSNGERTIGAEDTRGPFGVHGRSCAARTFVRLCSFGAYGRLRWCPDRVVDAPRHAGVGLLDGVGRIGFHRHSWRSRECLRTV